MAADLRRKEGERRGMRQRERKRKERDCREVRARIELTESIVRKCLNYNVVTFGARFIIVTERSKTVN